jgi:two-component system, OmpR family, phosphate regulon sensor histidine kinase PhoR
MAHPHPNPLGNKEGLLGRVAPYAGVALLGTALIPVMNLEAGAAFVVSIVGLTLAIVTFPWWVPWERLPYSAQAIPPISYLVVVALLRDADGGAVSGYGSLVALVVMWLAIYGTGTELAVGLAGVGAVFLVPPLLIGDPSYPSTELGRGILWLAVSCIIGYTTQQLVGRVRDQATDSDEHVQALRESEQRTRQILDSAQEAFVSMDSDSMIIDWNPQAQETFGWPRDEVLGRLLSDTIIPPRFREAHQNGVARFLETGDGPVLNQRLELSALHRDGHELPVELTISPLSRGGGYEFHAFLRDISERKQSEKYFGAQHEVTRVLAESAPGEDAMPEVLKALGECMDWEVGEYWSFDEHAQVLRYVDSWQVPSIDITELERVTRGLTFERGVGIPGRVWEQGKPVRIENIVESMFLRSSAAVRQGLRAAIGLPITSDSRLIGVMVFFSREIKALDADLMQMMGTLSTQVGQFMERRRMQREADSMKDEFFSLVSHEFRTPLTSITGYVELLTERDAELTVEERTHFLDVVKRNSKRLRRLVDDLLFISKVQAGKFSLTPRDVRLSELAEQAVEAAAPFAKENGLELSLEVEGRPTIFGDPDRLGQLLDNLISNAVKYTPEGERVDVRLSSSGDRVVAEVTNSGVYVPLEERARLFERFFRRPDTTAQEVQGVGLGLTIAQSIVHAHRGRIEVDSSAALGTTFRVELPVDDHAGSPRSDGREEIAA